MGWGGSATFQTGCLKHFRPPPIKWPKNFRPPPVRSPKQFLPAPVNFANQIRFGASRLPMPAVGCVILHLISIFLCNVILHDVYHRLFLWRKYISLDKLAGTVRKLWKPASDGFWRLSDVALETQSVNFKVITHVIQAFHLWPRCALHFDHSASKSNSMQYLNL